MTSYSKGAKRRAKRAARAMEGFDLQATPKRGKDKCFVERTRQQADDPQRTALQARVRHFGGEDTQKGRTALSDDYAGSQIGLVMKSKCSDAECTRLWRTFKAWCAAEDQYRRRYIGQSEHPKGAAIAMVPDRMETDSGHTVDLRDSETRDRDAINGWMKWQGHLGHLSREHHRAMVDARLERVDLWRDRKPTRRGLVALEALRKLHLVVEG